MDDTEVNIIFTNLLLQLMEKNKVYPVTVETEFGEAKFNLIRTEEDEIQFYEKGQIGSA